MKNKKAQESFLTLIVATFIIIFFIVLFVVFSFISNPFKGKTEVISEELHNINNNYLILNSLIFSQLEEKEKFNLTFFYELIYLYLENKEKRKEIEEKIKEKLSHINEYVFSCYIYDGETIENFLYIENLKTSTKLRRELLLFTFIIPAPAYWTHYSSYIRLPYNDKKIIIIRLTTF